MIGLRDSQGVPVAVTDGRAEVEEDRVYVVEAPGAWSARWDHRPLAEAGPGRFVLEVGRFVSPAPLVLRCERDGGAASQLQIVVLPRDEKLKPELFAALLEDLEGWIGGLVVGASGGRLGAVGLGGAARGLLVEALTALVPPLAEAFGALARDPRRRQVQTVDHRPLRQVARADREALTWLSRHPPLMAALRAGRLHETLPRTEVRDDLDHPANAWVVSVMGQVAQVLASTAEDLDRAGLSDEDRQWASVRADHLRASARHLEGALQRSPLAEVPPGPPTEAALLVAADDPLYARFRRLARPFLSPTFRLDGDGPAAMTRPSFHLYELWCLWAVQQALAAHLPAIRWRAGGLQRLLGPSGTGAGAGFVGRGAAGEVWRIEFNPEFSSYRAQHRGRRWSTSGGRRPDIVVSCSGGGQPARWLVLDAKWRVTRPNLTDAFASIHIYADSLRDDSAGGRAQGAVLLCPAQTPDTAEWFDPAYRAEFHQGVFALTPGSAAPADLAPWISAMLRPSEG